MSEMVDRVAMALKQVWQSGDKNPEYGELARAAIEAMRDPTDEMSKAGDGSFERDEDSSGDYRIYSADAGRCWSAMIDAALASNEPQAG